MTRSTEVLEHLSRAVGEPTNGVLGFADELLTAAQVHALRVGWHDGRCRIAVEEEAAEVRLPKSVVRAVLARMAVLCNEHQPDAVSPYGGHGEVGGIRVTFVNTPEEQNLELTPPAAPGANGTTARTRTPSCSSAPR